MRTISLGSKLASFLFLFVVTTAFGQAVDVTMSLDATNIPAGGSTTLRVFAQVVSAQRTNSGRIFSWYVDVLNTNGAVASANYNAMVKAASDKNLLTSSTGTPDGANRRGIYDTFINLAGAGVNAPVELVAIPITGVTNGQTSFQVQAGSGAALSSDFRVARIGGGAPLIGGNYSAAQVVLTVGASFPKGPLSISVTNAEGGARGVTLTFPPPSGFNVTVQFRDQLVGSPWQPVAGAPHNSGRAFDLTTSPSRFYRAIIAP